MLDKSKNYLIVGLGLLGGKYAQVLSQKGYNVTGITHSQSTLDYALPAFSARAPTVDLNASSIACLMMNTTVSNPARWASNRL